MAAQRKRAEAPEPVEGIATTIRLEGETVRRLDELVLVLKEQAPLGTRVTRSTALRHAILTGLDTSLR